MTEELNAKIDAATHCVVIKLIDALIELCNMNDGSLFPIKATYNGSAISEIRVDDGVLVLLTMDNQCIPFTELTPQQILPIVTDVRNTFGNKTEYGESTAHHIKVYRHQFQHLRRPMDDRGITNAQLTLLADDVDYLLYNVSSVSESDLNDYFSNPTSLPILQRYLIFQMYQIALEHCGLKYGATYIH